MQFAFGSGLLWGTRTDISNGTPVRFGVLQDVSIGFNGEIKELYGQYQMPVDVARGKVKIEGKAKLGRISAVMYNALFFGQTQSSGQKFTAYDEPGTTAIPATPFQLTVLNSATFVSDLGVRFATTGLPLTQVASGPTTGQYSVSGAGVYTFASADTTKSVLFDYVYSGVTGTTVAGANLLMGNTPRFSCTFSDIFEGVTVTMRLFACVSSKLSFASKTDDYMIPELDFQAFQNAAGQVFEFTASE
jgi:hypothetical protein